MSSAECLVGVHSCMDVNRPICGEFCGVHSWQNGTRCMDGVNVLLCHSYLVWLVFESSIPTCACFHPENFLVTSFYCFLNGKREERWEGRPRGRCMLCKIQNFVMLLTKNSGCKFKCFQPKL